MAGQECSQVGRVVVVGVADLDGGEAVLPGEHGQVRLVAASLTGALAEAHPPDELVGSIGTIGRDEPARCGPGGASG